VGTGRAAVQAELEGSDAEIVALAREGGAEALQSATSRALRRYLRDLYGHVKSRLPEDEAAVQDILQEVALAVVEGLPRLRSGAALRPWLLQIASHKVCDHLRRQQRARLRLYGDLGARTLQHLVDEQGSMERLLERAGEEQLAAYLRRTVDRLKPRHREVVTLVYFEGLSLEAVGARLRLRNDAVASLLYRARRAFQKLLTKDRRAGAHEPFLSSLTEAVRKC
jgi:RNA polymerase sigma-70 factor (ECF subfamily)